MPKKLAVRCFLKSGSIIFMSRLAKKAISIPEGVTVKLSDGIFSCTGKNGTLSVPVLPFLILTIDQDGVLIRTNATNSQARANWGTMASLIRNAVQGVVSGYTKDLEVQGVGFKANLDGATLVLNLGFTHQIKFPIPVGIKIVVEKNVIKISGNDKALVGETAAIIRRFKKPEPYKGKGIRYVGEVVRRKAGKKVAGTTA